MQNATLGCVAPAWVAAFAAMTKKGDARARLENDQATETIETVPVLPLDEL